MLGRTLLDVNARWAKAWHVGYLCIPAGLCPSQNSIGFVKDFYSAKFKSAEVLKCLRIETFSTKMFHTDIGDVSSDIASGITKGRRIARHYPPDLACCGTLSQKMSPYVRVAPRSGGLGRKNPKIYETPPPI